MAIEPCPVIEPVEIIGLDLDGLDPRRVDPRCVGNAPGQVHWLPL